MTAIAIGSIGCASSEQNKLFENVDEISIFRVRGGKLAFAVGVEDNLTRMRQLGIIG